MLAFNVDRMATVPTPARFERSCWLQAKNPARLCIGLDVIIHEFVSENKLYNFDRFSVDSQ